MVTLVPRERVQQLTAEQIGNVPRGDAKYSATATRTTVAKLGGGETTPEFPKDSATTANPVVVSSVAESVGDGKVRPPEFAKHNTTTESKVAERSGGAGPTWPRAKSTPSAGVTAAARTAGEARPPGIAKQSASLDSDIAGSSDEARPPGIEKQGATTDSDIAVSSDEAGPSRPKANGRNSRRYSSCKVGWGKLGLLESKSGVARQSLNSQRVGPSWPKANSNRAVATAAVMSAGEARPHGMAKQSATTKSGRAGPSWSGAFVRERFQKLWVDVPQVRN